METKYEVGDWVTLRGVKEEHEFIIKEVVQRTCSAGTQTTYNGRLYHQMPQKGTAFTVPAIEIAETEIKGKIETI